MCELIDKYFIAIAGGILSICFASYVAWRTFQKRRFISAADKFRDVILKELEGLYPIPSNWPTNAFHIGKVLTDKFGIISSAVESFRPHVPFYKRTSFDRAWFRYYNAYADEPAYNRKKEQSYDHYMDFQDNPNPKETFRKNVAALLKFAE